MRQIDWSDLQSFLSLAKAGHAGTAAAKLNIDATTLRRRLNELERSTGLRLFERQGRSLKLTEHGRRALPLAARVEELVAEIGAVGVDNERELSGTVRIATMDAFGSFYLAPRLAKLLTLQERLSIELVTGPRRFDLARREADIALTLTNASGAGTSVQKIGSFSVGAYGTSAYFDVHGVPQSPAELGKHWFVTYVDELGSVPHDPWLPTLVDKPKVRLSCTSLAGQLEAAREGLGLAMLPYFMTTRYAELRRVLPDEVHLLRGIWVAVRHEMQDVPRIRAVKDHLTSLITADKAVLQSKVS